jgi:hypothetical protein
VCVYRCSRLPDDDNGEEGEDINVCLYSMLYSEEEEKEGINTHTHTHTNVTCIQCYTMLFVFNGIHRYIFCDQCYTGTQNCEERPLTSPVVRSSTHLLRKPF